MKGADKMILNSVETPANFTEANEIIKKERLREQLGGLVVCLIIYVVVFVGVVNFQKSPMSLELIFVGLALANTAYAICCGYLFLLRHIVRNYILAAIFTVVLFFAILYGLDKLFPYPISSLEGEMVYYIYTIVTLVFLSLIFINLLLFSDYNYIK